MHFMAPELNNLRPLRPPPLEAEPNGIRQGSTRTREPSTKAILNIPDVDEPPSANVVFMTVAEAMDYVGITESPAEPASYKEAMASAEWKEWHKAMEDEVKCLAKFNTWELTPRPEGVKVLSTKWVFKKKPARYKARFTPRGFEDRTGSNDTYASTAMPKSLKIFMAFAVKHKLFITQLDVTTAYLHAPLAEDIYVEQPEGFASTTHPDWVCHLRRALYGLKQSARAWEKKLTEVLLLLDFKRLKNDHSIFILVDEHGNTAILLTYVDDLKLGVSTRPFAYHICRSLQKYLDIRMENDDFLGLHIEVEEPGQEVITIDQRIYINKVLQRFGFRAHERQRATPIAVSKTKLERAPEGQRVTDFPYREERRAGPQSFRLTGVSARPSGTFF